MKEKSRMKEVLLDQVPGIKCVFLCLPGNYFGRKVIKSKVDEENGKKTDYIFFYRQGKIKMSCWKKC